MMAAAGGTDDHQIPPRRCQAGDSHEQCMGRWSRHAAPRFLGWLDPPAGLDWLEVGCGPTVA